MKDHVLRVLVGFISVTPLLFGQTNAPSPVEQLQEFTAQVQKSPDDQALREKIINLAHELKPTPALPDEAERRMARGITAFKGAQSVADYQDAVKEFAQATLAAPWYGDAYFNLGVAQDKAEQYDAAIRSLKLALLASPSSKDIKDLMYQVEYRADQANTPEGKAAAKYGPAQHQFAALIQKLDGAVFASDLEVIPGSHTSYEMRFYKTGRYHLLVCDRREKISDAWEDQNTGEFVMPSNGLDGLVLFMFKPTSGQEFFQGCRMVGRPSADGRTIDAINNWSRKQEVISVWHRQ